MLKRSVKGRRWNFWRSYSFVLTLVVLCSLSVVAASAKKYSIENGLIKVQDVWGGNSWTNLSWGAKTPSVATEAQFDAQWQALAEDVGIMSMASGGLTQDELNSSLESYVGKPVGQYVFETFSNHGISIVVRDLYDAIAKNQVYGSMFLDEAFREYLLFDAAFDQYLGADGSILTAPANGDRSALSLGTMLGNGILGLRSVMLDNASTNHLDVTSGFSTTHQDLDALLSKLTAVNTNVINFKSTNHTDLTSGFSTNHQDLLRVNKSLVGSGSASAVFWDSTTKAETTRGYTDVLSTIASLGSSMQNDLAKLRYVLASDKDIEIAEKQEPVKDAVSDSFAGDSPAAVKPGDVGDMAGISGSLQDSLNTGAHPSDLLNFINGSDGWGFWSQEVADGLHNVPVSLADDEISVQYSDIDSLDDLFGVDFIHFYDPSALEDYLSRGDVS